MPAMAQSAGWWWWWWTPLPAPRCSAFLRGASRPLDAPLCTGIRDPLHQVTPLTLALLNDTTWYVTVPYTMAGYWTWGRGRGCAMAMRHCVTLLLLDNITADGGDGGGGYTGDGVRQYEGSSGEVLFCDPGGRLGGPVRVGLHTATITVTVKSYRYRQVSDVLHADRQLGAVWAAASAGRRVRCTSRRS
jgi:hypothetical protein